MAWRTNTIRVMPALLSASSSFSDIRFQIALPAQAPESISETHKQVQSCIRQNADARQTYPAHLSRIYLTACRSMPTNNKMALFACFHPHCRQLQMTLTYFSDQIKRHYYAHAHTFTLCLCEYMRVMMFRTIMLTASYENLTVFLGLLKVWRRYRV